LRALMASGVSFTTPQIRALSESHFIHREAMQIILVHIAKKETCNPCLSLSRWEIEHAELVNFLLEIIGVVLFSKRGCGTCS
jgi:hypothetical protein